MRKVLEVTTDSLLLEILMGCESDSACAQFQPPRANGMKNRCKHISSTASKPLLHLTGIMCKRATPTVQRVSERISDAADTHDRSSFIL